ncbi:MAG: hypothetical protein ACRD4T_00325, partial [Candidatus Acidiferrales bacterium]
LLPARLLWIEGEQFGLLVFSAAALAWLLVPFLDRNPEGRSGRVFKALGAAILVYLAILSVWGYIG